MHTIFYFTIGCAILGGLGIAIANINEEDTRIRRRWIWYYTHIVTTLVIIISIFSKIFSVFTILIILAGYFEVIRAVIKYKHRSFPLLITSLAGFTLIAAGFWFFSFIFNPYFRFSVFLQVLMFEVFSQVTIFVLKKAGLANTGSTGKSVESVVGGFLFCVITAIVVSAMMNVSFGVSLFIGVLTATTAVTGDLLASWFRRKMQVRYYSRLLPGLGGFLDRFDSYMVSGMVYYCLAITALKDLFAPLLVSG
jgi:phosphatidate cytidylyltransferase